MSASWGPVWVPYVVLFRGGLTHLSPSPNPLERGLWGLAHGLGAKLTPLGLTFINSLI